MTFKLNKSEVAQKAELMGQIADAKLALDTAIENYNSAVAGAKKTLLPAIETYNETLSAALEFTQDIAGQAQSDIGDKSERWQEGERGQAAVAWGEEWSNATFDPIEVELPDDLEIDIEDHADMLDCLPDEAE